MTRFMAAVTLGVTLFGAGCSTPTVYDGVYDKTAQAVGSATMLAASPATAVGAAWVDPYERKAEDISLADLPYFAAGLLDPTQLLPPPFGTFYAPWKIFVTVVRGFPFVTWRQAGENAGQVTFVSGEHPGPLWYAVGPAIEDMDSFAAPVHETVAADHTPVPGNGDWKKYWGLNFNSNTRNIQHAGYTLKYVLLNTNSDLPPYDNFYPDELSRDKTTIHKTFDTFLFGFDWDDPYVN